ncbi:hypothetical protein [Dechloromonas sp.]|uniref:hypothetical protein n=1 Tax=Dechloromonas sp. TaxID=1917218 RepID=UPI00263F87EE|nr:hypothetical protein [Dechloromonas sp.]
MALQRHKIPQLLTRYRSANCIQSVDLLAEFVVEVLGQGAEILELLGLDAFFQLRAQ